MNFEIAERLALVELMTIDSGNYKLIDKLRNERLKVDFSRGEVEKLKMRRGADGKIYYDTILAKMMVRDIKLDDWTLEFLTERLKWLDEHDQMRENYMSVFEKLIVVDQLLPEVDEETAKKLKEARKGKKTVAIVGMAPRSCSLAPFKEKDVELWGLNEAHVMGWMTRATRWFQIHNSFRQKVAKRGIKSHYDWLVKNEWDIPIYMIRANPDVPKSTPYPLQEVCDKLLGGIRRGEARIKYFNSSFDYMMGVALLEDYERIEAYGFDMATGGEYDQQKPSAEFWIGLAAGRGAEVYLPPGCLLLTGDVYGGMDQGEGWDDREDS